MVRYERDGTAAVVTIDRPERRNAVDGETAAALLAAYERFAADDETRVMVLTGAGDEAFCAGADLKALETLDPDAPAGPMGFSRLTPAKPAIAAISGWCVAGGLELALWCDLRVAAEGARFGCLERRWGVPLIDGGTQRLPRVIGLGRALDLILTARTVETEEALAIGLVNAVVPAGEHVARALALAEAIAAHPQATMLSDREAAHAALGLPIGDGLALEARLGRDRLAAGLDGARRFTERG
jgi:enoyl-CoA hydratase